VYVCEGYCCDVIKPCIESNVKYILVAILISFQYQKVLYIFIVIIGLTIVSHFCLFQVSMVMTHHVHVRKSTCFPAVTVYVYQKDGCVMAT